MAEAAGGSGGGGGGAPSGGEDSPSSFSPKNRLKFLCSYGGRILPRPSDVHFKYVGGDTRVLVVSRSISFHELKKTIQDMFRAEVVIKYQLAAVDLDVLVTVAGDDDLTYMFEEYDRLDAFHPNSPSCSSSPRFRLFIFPSVPAPHPDAAVALDQPSYIADAGNVKRSIFSISSSARTSPTSSVDGVAVLLGHRKPSPVPGGGMHRVRSTPNLGDGSGGSNGSNGSGGSLVSLVQPTGLGPKSGGVTNQYQHHQHLHQHVHWQHGHGGVTSRQQGSAPGVGVGPWRMPGPAVRYDMCGCQMALQAPPPPPTATLRGGYHYAPPYAAGYGGYVCFGNGEEPPQNTARVGPPRSPRGGSGAPNSPSAGAGLRRPSVWDELPQ